MEVHNHLANVSDSVNQILKSEQLRADFKVKLVTDPS